VRPAVATDEQRLLEWANERQVRRNAFDPAPIPAREHRRWFARRLADTRGTRLYIVESAAGEALGQVRFQLADEGWEVHYSVAREFRGGGLGRDLLRAAMATFAAEMGAVQVQGRTLPQNRPSRRIFEALGFTRCSGAEAGITRYVRTIPPP
jgi:RimJ/RimL family protein N-acetyltransferase